MKKSNNPKTHENESGFIVQQPLAQLPEDYGELLSALKKRIRTAQVKAALSANRELIGLYWDIGRAILRAQNEQGWGAKVVIRLAMDLRREFPQMGGFSRAHLLFLRAFVQAWSDSSIVLQPVRQLMGAYPKGANRPTTILNQSDKKYLFHFLDF